MKLRTAGLILLMLTAGWQRVSAQGSAGQAGEYLRWGVGARALALGRAFTSISDDASALYWNPAGLSSLSRVGGTVMFMHLPLREGASFNYLAGAIPLRILFVKHTGNSTLVNLIQNFSLGLGIAWQGLGEFQLFDENASPVSGGSGNSVDDRAVYVSFAYPLHDVLRRLPRLGFFGRAGGELDVGLTAKFLHQDLFGVSGSATSFDLGFKYAHHSGLFNLGFTLHDLNHPGFSYDADIVGDKIPTTGVVGGSLRPPFGRLRGLLLSADYGIVTPSGRDKEIMVGAEYDLSVLSAQLPMKVRVGLNSEHESLTVGLSFSPEEVLGHDWLPSGDWTYANDRSSFDAVGARYSFSVDRNPFTAKYWYLNAMVQLFGYGCDNLSEIKKSDRVTQYLKNAQDARNPGRHAYRYEAALRLVDLRFLTAVSELQNARREEALKERAVQHFRKIANSYFSAVRRAEKADYGKKELDEEAYFHSFVYYLQSLILAGDYEAVWRASADSGKSWGKHRNLLKSRSAVYRSRADFLHFLEALAFYKGGATTEAISMLRQNLPDNSLAGYLLGHIEFLEGNYQTALLRLKEVNLNDVSFPRHLYVPVTSDCTFGDEVLFLQAASMFKLGRPPEEYLAEFAKIPRFFPSSDLAKFLTRRGNILATMIRYVERGEQDELAALTERVIRAYIESFSIGTLKEEVYTYNYR
ncbi:MAG: hypothetical protein D6743_17390 [Calditrichaeota bacterium]|nr:MAG: hypothetical protein D6743_17390 [Calditrichota bacterium]